MSRPPGTFVALLLLWLAGGNLRVTMLAVPPLQPLIHRDLHLTEAAVGALNTLPIVLFAVMAVAGSALIARFGARRTLIAGLLLVACAGALRGAIVDTAFLFAMTFLMGAGIAVMQPAMPPLVRDWQPQRIALASAVYTNGMMIWETLSASATIPWLLPLLDDSWRLSFVVWSIPAVVTAVLFLALTRPDAPVQPGARPAVRWWPDWRSTTTWKMGVMLGSGSSLYFGANAFLPDFLTRAGRAAEVGPALAALNVAQIPASLLLLVFAPRLVGRPWPFHAIAVAGIVSLGCIAFVPGANVVLWAAVLGFFCAAMLAMTLALPPLLARPEDVHRLSAGMFTIGYPVTVLVPVLGGLAWDLTGRPVAAFVPVMAGGLLMATMAATVEFPKRA